MNILIEYFNILHCHLSLQIWF